MRRQTKQRTQDRILRVLTLVCFFHFSGLNNGFSMVVVSAGRTQRVDFAPVMARQLVAGLNPGNWKRFFFDPIRFRLVKRSANVISLASQRAIQSVLVESSHLQVWLVDSCLKGSEISPEKSLVRGKSAVEKTLSMKSGSSRVEIEVQGGVSDWARPMILLGQAAKGYQIEQASSGYLQGEKSELWFKGRYFFRDGDKNRDGPFFRPAGLGGTQVFQIGEPPPGPQNRLKKFVKFVRDPFKIRTHYASDRSEGDSFNLALVAHCPVFKGKRGFSFWEKS